MQIPLYVIVILIISVAVLPNLYFQIIANILVGLLSTRSKAIQPTWGCAYTAPTSKIQYTGKSFSKTLSKMFNFIVIERKQYEELNKSEIFPKKRKHASHYHDYIYSHSF